KQPQRQPPELPHGDTAHHQRNAQRRKHRQQTVDAGQRSRRELPENDVVTSQIGQEQQPERTGAFLLAQAVRRVAEARQKAVQEGRPGQRVENKLADGGAGEGDLRHQQQRADEQYGRQRRKEPKPIEGLAPRPETQFPLDDWQETHRAPAAAGANGAPDACCAASSRKSSRKCLKAAEMQSAAFVTLMINQSKTRGFGSANRRISPVSKTRNTTTLNSAVGSASTRPAVHRAARPLWRVLNPCHIPNIATAATSIRNVPTTTNWISNSVHPPGIDRAVPNPVMKSARSSASTQSSGLKQRLIIARNWPPSISLTVSGVLNSISRAPHRRSAVNRLA